MSLKVAWVTRYPPNAQVGGAAAHEFHLLRHLSERHHVHVISGGMPPGLTTLDLGERRIPIEGVEYRMRWPLADTRLRKLTTVARDTLAWPSVEIQIGRERDRALARALSRLQDLERIDLVHITIGELAPVLKAARAPSALLLFDVYARQMEREREVAERLRRRLRFELKSRKVAAWERRWYRRADALACVSEVDAAALAEDLGRPVDVIPNPIPEEYFAPPEVPRSPATVTITGILSWRPNLDALAWLATEIWPRVVARRPDARLEVVGSEPDAEAERLAAAAGATLHADVPDIRPHYWGAAVSVAPVRLGSGMRNKVIHAMACGAPVVATSAAVEGIGAMPGVHFLAADDAEGLADAIVATLDDPGRAAERAARARALVEPLRADGAARRLEDWWSSVATPPAPVPPASPPSSASVVICTRERPELLRAALASVARLANGDIDTEVIVVEQGAPAAEAICSEIGLAATVIRDGGSGTSRARNIALRRARGDVILITDDDCEVPQSWVRDHLAEFRDPEIVGSFGAVEGLSRVPGFDPAAVRGRQRKGAPPWFVGHGSNMAARRDALLAVGGFDERIGPGTRTAAGEDADLIVRLFRSDGVVATGVGSPVRHASWRSPDENERNLLAYERGAGVWIGKTLRAEKLGALVYLRARLDQIWDLTAGARPRRPGLFRMGIAFAAGLARGMAMGRDSAP